MAVWTKIASRGYQGGVAWTATELLIPNLFLPSRCRVCQVARDLQDVMGQLEAVVEESVQKEKEVIVRMSMSSTSSNECVVFFGGEGGVHHPGVNPVCIRSCSRANDSSHSPRLQ